MGSRGGPAKTIPYKPGIYTTVLVRTSGRRLTNMRPTSHWFRLMSCLNKQHGIYTVISMASGPMNG